MGGNCDRAFLLNGLLEHVTARHELIARSQDQPYAFRPDVGARIFESPLFGKLFARGHLTIGNRLTFKKFGIEHFSHGILLNQLDLSIMLFRHFL